MVCGCGLYGESLKGVVVRDRRQHMLICFAPTPHNFQRASDLCKIWYGSVQDCRSYSTYKKTGDIMFRLAVGAGTAKFPAVGALSVL